jgi:hypothetical protein
MFEGSSALTFAASCGCEAIFSAIGLVAVVVAEPLVVVVVDVAELLEVVAAVVVVVEAMVCGLPFVVDGPWVAGAAPCGVVAAPWGEGEDTCGLPCACGDAARIGMNQNNASAVALETAFSVRMIVPPRPEGASEVPRRDRAEPDSGAQLPMRNPTVPFQAYTVVFGRRPPLMSSFAARSRIRGRERSRYWRVSMSTSFWRGAPFCLDAAHQRQRAHLGAKRRRHDPPAQARIARDRRQVGSRCGTALGILAAVGSRGEDPGGVFFLAETGVWAALGTGIGVGISAATEHEQLIYRNGAPGAPVTLSPLAGAGRAGVLVSLRF